MSQQTVSAEVAEAEFQRFIDAMDLKLDPDAMSKSDKTDFTALKQTIVDAIQTGHVAINDDGEPVLHPKTGDSKDPITFHEPNGGVFSSMDQVKDGHKVAKLRQLMAGMTREPAKRFTNMKQRDLKVCDALLLLFLA